MTMTCLLSANSTSPAFFREGRGGREFSVDGSGGTFDGGPVDPDRRIGADGDGVLARDGACVFHQLAIDARAGAAAEIDDQKLRASPEDRAVVAADGFVIQEQMGVLAAPHDAHGKRGDISQRPFIAGRRD
jgi:hypothetical protein